MASRSRYCAVAYYTMMANQTKPNQTNLSLVSQSLGVGYMNPFSPLSSGVAIRFSYTPRTEEELCYEQDYLSAGNPTREFYLIKTISYMAERIVGPGSFGVVFQVRLHSVLL
ncbi:hypothetical protein RHMOL_Rhmol01G0120100 [Rhododendron molle]|uniref:Uncharacterized protein n=1 Tax=Rhododendron molle TaxID=49168 RepID=A0ACC0Q131_RHOML|nr:hypothetical protein RHMOL_Rhmol01G0120100 [Rhododendron molle]